MYNNNNNDKRSNFRTTFQLKDATVTYKYKKYLNQKNMMRLNNLEWCEHRSWFPGWDLITVVIRIHKAEGMPDQPAKLL